jgi:Fe-S cluster biosynthesis and repair protein YggX
MKVLVKRSLSKLQKNKARNFIKINKKKKTHFSKHQKATIQIKKLNFIKLKRKQFVHCQIKHFPTSPKSL